VPTLSTTYSVARTAAYNEVRALNIKFSSRSTPGTLDAGRMDASQLDVYATRLAQLAQSHRHPALMVRNLLSVIRRSDAQWQTSTAHTDHAESALPPCPFGVVPEDQPKPAAP